GGIRYRNVTGVQACALPILERLYLLFFFYLYQAHRKNSLYIILAYPSDRFFFQYSTRYFFNFMPICNPKSILLGKQIYSKTLIAVGCSRNNWYRSNFPCQLLGICICPTQMSRKNRNNKFSFLIHD